MAIPEGQLKIWENLPDPEMSAKSYAAVKEALEDFSITRIFTQDVYLQGSYANHTNIRADSDVDVVAELTSSFQNEVKYLSGDALDRFDALPSATTTLEEYKAAVIARLERYFGETRVEVGKKCVKIEPRGGLLPIDLLVCQNYRLWVDFTIDRDQRYLPGVVFYTSDGRRVINYPKLHLWNGSKKNEDVKNLYKPTVRIFKNARRRLVEDGKLTKNLAPSYFIECLVYNVPDPEFTYNAGLSYISALVWLANNEELFSNFDCQNRRLKLFGDTPEQWSTASAHVLVRELISQWCDWSGG